MNFTKWLAFVAWLVLWVRQNCQSDVGSSDDEAVVNAFVPMYALNNVNFNIFWHKPTVSWTNIFCISLGKNSVTPLIIYLGSSTWLMLCECHLFKIYWMKLILNFNFRIIGSVGRPVDQRFYHAKKLWIFRMRSKLSKHVIEFLPFFSHSRAREPNFPRFKCTRECIWIFISFIYSSWKSRPISAPKPHPQCGLRTRVKRREKKSKYKRRKKICSSSKISARRN